MAKNDKTVPEKVAEANEADTAGPDSGPVKDQADGKPNPKGDTVDPPPKLDEPLTAAEVEKTPVPDQILAGSRLARERQFPSLSTAKNGDAIEVAERSSDVETAIPPGETVGDRTGDEPSLTHVKDFVTTKREWDSEDHEAVHERNKRAVRQYMVNQGIRPTGAVVSTGVTVGDPIRFREDLAKVTLSYGVEGTPAAVAVGMEQVHVVIDQNGPSATELAEFQAGTETRIREARVVRAGA